MGIGSKICNWSKKCKKGSIMEPVINLELTVKEVNVILVTLGKHPFEEVNILINKILKQGETQLAEFKAEQSDKKVLDEETQS